MSIPAAAVPPFISTQSFAVRTADVRRLSAVLRLTRTIQAHHLRHSRSLALLSRLLRAVPGAVPRFRASLRPLLAECTARQQRRRGLLRRRLRLVLFAPCAEQRAVRDALRALRQLALAPPLRAAGVAHLVDVLRGVLARGAPRDALARRRLDRRLVAGVAAVRCGAQRAFPSLTAVVRESETVTVVLRTRYGPPVQEGEVRMRLEGGTVELPSGGRVQVWVGVGAGVCDVNVRNVGQVEIWVVRVDMAATRAREMRVLLPTPTVMQRLLRRYPSLVVRGGTLRGAGRTGGAWAALSVR